MVLLVQIGLGVVLVVLVGAILAVGIGRGVRLADEQRVAPDAGLDLAELDR